MAEIEIVITGRDEFSGPLGNITSSLSDFGNIITGIQSAFSLVGDALETVLTPIIEFGQEAVLAAARVSELQAVNRILAENAGIDAAAVQGVANAIRAQGIEAGVAQGVVAAFITANLDLGAAADLARVAQDAAVISGQNSTETLQSIVYGIETLNPLVLRHAGIVVDLQLAYKEWAAENDRTVESLTTAEKQQIAFNEVMEAGVGIAGAYAAAMEEPGKVLRSFPRYFDDILIAVGEPFQEAFGTAIFAIGDFLKELGKELGEEGSLKPSLDIFGFIVNDILETALSLTGDIDWDTIGTELRGIASDAYTIWHDTKQLIDDVQAAFDDGGFSGVFDLLFGDIDAQTIVDWLDDLDVALAAGVESHDWTSSGAAFGDMIGELFGQSIDSQDSSAIPALGAAISDWFLAAAGVADWGEFKSVFLGILDEFVLQAAIDWFKAKSYESHLAWVDFWSNALDLSFLADDIFKPEFLELGRNIIQGFTEGWNASVQFMKDTVRLSLASLIQIVKDVFGISSPSTVFMGIGRDIVLGLMSGFASMIFPLTTLIDIIVRTILGPFAPILDLLGIDIGTVGGGSTGSHTPGGGTIPTIPGSPTGGGTVVNQYFAGATINVGAWDEIAYDCIYPNPFVAATSGQLMTGGGSTGGGGGDRR